MQKHKFNGIEQFDYKLALSGRESSIAAFKIVSVIFFLRKK